MKKTMKRILIATLLVCSILAFSGLSFAGDVATKDECVAMCKKAAAMITKKGVDAGLAEVGNPKGQFVWKDSYVFALSTKNGNTLAHPLKPGLIGKNLMGVRDINGVMLFAEFLKVGQSASGAGWVSYMWPKPGEKKPSPKNAYIFKVPGHDISMGAGVYE